MEDSALIQQLAAGNNEAFRLLSERYGRMLYICAYKFVRDEDLAPNKPQK